MDLIEDMRQDAPPLEDLRRTPLGSIDPARAASVGGADSPGEADLGRIRSAPFGSAL